MHQRTDLFTVLGEILFYNAFSKNKKINMTFLHITYKLFKSLTQII